MECFRELDSDSIEALTRELDVDLFAEGDVLMKEGATGSKMFFLLHGSVDISQGGQHIASLGAGSFVGEMACLGLSSKRTCTVVASEFCDCRSISEIPLKAFLNRYPKVRDHLVFQSRVEYLERVGKAKEKQARLDRSISRSTTRQFGVVATARGDDRRHSSEESHEAPPAEDQRRGTTDSIAIVPPSCSPPEKSSLAFRKGRLLASVDTSVDSIALVPPSCSPPEKSSSAFRKGCLRNMDSETRSVASVDTSVPSSRATSADSCSTFESSNLSDAPTDRNPIFIASPVRRKAILPNISPANGNCTAKVGGQEALKDAMRAKNDLLRTQLKRARADLSSTCASASVQQIDQSHISHGRTF
jgi:CRP-like cAMP-binding protein